MTFGIIFLYLLIPAVIILFICAVAAASLNKAKYAEALFVSCLLLPAFFLGGLQAMKAVGWARYEAPGVNDMRPIDEEANGNIIIVYTKESNFEEQQILANKVISPWKEGQGFTGETGVQASIGLLDMDGRIAEKILFRQSATEVEKENLRMGLMASPIVYRYFENVSEGEVRHKLEQRNTNKQL